MAGINGFDPVQKPLGNPAIGAEQPVKAPETVKPQQQETKTPEQPKQVKGLEIEDVISVSQDGDTVQARRESLEKLEDDRFGRVIKLEEEQSAVKAAEAADTRDTKTDRVNEDATKSSEVIEEARREREKIAEAVEEAAEAQAEVAKASVNPQTESPNAAQTRDQGSVQRAEERGRQQEEEEAYQAPITSFSGYTDQQLQQLYQKGEISKQTYDKEVASREQAREEQKSNNTEFATEMAGNAAAAEETAREGAQLETAFSPNANDTPEAADRVAAMAAVDKMFE